MVTYLNKEILPSLFGYLQERYARIEEVPNYEDETSGLAKLIGVLERIQMDAYYPSLIDKASTLLVEVNKGHFFSNGNKRLALVATTIFLDLNNRQLKEMSKDDYCSILSGLFPEYIEWTDFAEFTPTDFATYHLSIIVAESGALGIDHDALKTRIKTFFEQTTELSDLV